MEISIGATIGMCMGMICGILGLWFGRKKARKNRGLDELYSHIWQKTRSYSWYVTLGAIFVLFSLNVLGIELSSAMVLGILLFVHIGSWGIIGIILPINMSGTFPLPLSRVKFGIIVIATSIIVFTIMSIIANNWMFLLFSILPNLIGLFIALTANRKDSE
ncbi:hypothetical protein [Paenibacillus glacialis]|uniref:Uncharacterized protein n=1 Tax=Paenibacillus glacialis TaxID=494026 RepID=A0A168FBL8_9BACL|nr:hypothetical protein [Paenibacillus glacialis]OAB36051.1 hypothetical protein PGLA_21790 [Paenibacillus glacialis]